MNARQMRDAHSHTVYYEDGDGARTRITCSEGWTMLVRVFGFEFGMV